MTAFDTDVLTEIFLGDQNYLQRLQSIIPSERAIPIVAAEEVLRGRLNIVRKAQSGKARISLDYAYKLFQIALVDINDYAILPYNTKADQEYAKLRLLKLKIGTQDLRIAAVCLVHQAKLISRNARDYVQIPNLDLEIWN